MSESEEFENFTDAHSSSNDKNSPLEIFSIEGPSSIDIDNNSEGDEFYDVIDEPKFQRDNKREFVEEHEIQDSKPLPPLPPRNKNRMTILEFLQEEDEEEEEEVNELETGLKRDSDLNKRETIFEFLQEYSDEEDVVDVEKSESSLSRLQRELETEPAGQSKTQAQEQFTQEQISQKERVINLPSVNNSLHHRRDNSLIRRANPLASFFKDTSGSDTPTASDSDSMLSELTEALTTRTDLSEAARFSRVPSMANQPAEYLKLAKRFKPVPVKCKSKQKSEFTSLFLIQELNRRPSDDINNIKRTSSVGSNSSQPATDPSKAIFSLTFSPDGHFLAAAGSEGIIRIWSLLQVIDPATNSVPRVATIFESEPVQVLKGHTAEILDCAWSSNNFLLTASMDKTVRLWHHSRPDALGIFQHLDYVTSVAFHPRDPRIFISGSLDCKLRLWSIQDRSIINWNELPPGNFITAVAFTRSGASVIAGTSGGTALIFDTEGLRYNTQILVRSSRSKSVGKKITSITAVPGQFDNDERIIISSNDSRIRMYSLRDKNVIYKYKGHENVSSQIGASLATDADYVLSGSEDCRVYLWRADGKFEKKGLFGSFRKDHISSYESFKAHSNPVTAAIIAPNCVSNLLQSLQLRPVNQLQAAEGKIIITADVTGQIKVFENNSKLVEWLK